MENKKKIKKPVSGKNRAKVPVVMQLEALECGAASLAMVLAYYDRWIPLEQVRRDCGVSRDGSNLLNVMRAAQSYGLNADAYRVEPEDLKKEGSFPCIIHWNFNHFVVLDGFKRGKAVINDPARGEVEVSMEEFDHAFTGVALMLEPGENFQPGGKPRSVLNFARQRLRGTGAAIIFTILLSVITSIMGIISPVFTKIFIDRLLPGRNLDWMTPFFIGLTVFSFIDVVIAWLSAVYMLRINGKMATVGSSTYMWKVLRLPMEFYSQRMAGDIQQRQYSNANIASSLVNTLAPMALDTVMMVYYLVFMLRYSPLLTLIGLSSTAVNMMISQLISIKRVNLTRVQMRDAGKLASTTVSGIEMIESIKSSGAENGYFERWSGFQASVNTQEVRVERVSDYLGLIPSIVSTISSTMILIVGIGLVMQGKFTIGNIYAFQGFLASFLSPASKLVSVGQTLQEMRTQMERIEDVMEYPTDVNYEHEQKADEEGYQKLSGHVELKNVTFGYAPLGKPLIVDLNLDIKPGSRVALVGASGCGKSTVSKLVSGLYQPWSGEILFDGKPASQIDRSVFTGSLAVVDQDIILFEDTIANNIKMWDKSIEDFEMILAARDAQIHNDIMLRDGGYQYKIMEGGKDFSGGQRQRLEIARVLAQDPTIIILDEATSALDAKTEFQVVNAIQDRGITCIVVAHRLSTIRDCDEILVLDQGRVVERGTHEELFALGGYYSQLVTSE